MPTFECNSCNFTTDRKLNYDRHLLSARHIAKITQSFDCKHCGSEFKSKQSKWNHENYVCKANQNINNNLLKVLLQKLDDKDKIIEDKNKIIENQLKVCNDERKDLLEVVKSGNKNTSKSMSTLAYVVKNYNKAPAMKKLTDKNAIKMLEYKGKGLTSEEMMIYKYDKGILDEYLGDIIINTFLDSDSPAKQSMWTSDVARLCFVIMHTVSKGRREWIADKSGVKITELIINPLLKNAKNMLNAYIKEAGKMHDGTKILSEESEYDDSDESISSYNDSDSENEKYDKTKLHDPELLKNMQVATNIRAIIDNNTLHKDILTHICPFFKLNVK